VSRRRLIAFGVFIAGLLLVPLGLIAVNELRLASGKHVLLHVEPVDPNDPVRGEYVALSYDISRVPGADADGAGPRDVYVILERRGRAWTGLRATGERPADGETFIRGVARNGTIEYGIETYYVEEGESPRYERAIARQELYVDVVLDDGGGAKIDKPVILPS
jgi:uncharacterized membrane-anchored protein